MKCDKCAKKSTVHLTEIVDGKVVEMHLCEDCARQQSDQMDQQFGLADLLAGLTDFGKQVPDAAPKAGALACPACGLTYEDFRKFGRFGCAACYGAFKPQLKTLLKKIHGSSVHLGKKIDVPPEAAPAVLAAEAPAPEVPLDPLGALRAQLQEAIRREDFEQAAALRDQIHLLERQG